MKGRIRLVLARWADVEPNDVVWHNDALWRVTGEAFDDPETDDRYKRPGYLAWPVEKVDGDYYDQNTLIARPDDRVPVAES